MSSSLKSRNLSKLLFFIKLAFLTYVVIGLEDGLTQQYQFTEVENTVILAVKIPVNMSYPHQSERA